MKKNKKEKEYVLEMTEEKRDKLLARGEDENVIPAVGKHRFRRVSPDRVAKRNEQKIKITMFLDADILDYFKARAAEENAAPYQTQINNALRRVMETNQAKSAAAAVGEAFRSTEDILNDEQFLRALKEKLALV